MATEQKKWAGSVTEVISAPVDKVWAILGDFDGLKKNFPEIFVSSETTEGEANKVGSVRTVKVQQPDGRVIEGKERCLVLDNEKHTIIYVMEGHPVMSGYKVEISAEKQEKDKTSVVWNFEVNSNSVMTEEGFLKGGKAFAQNLLATLGKKLSQ